MVRLRLPLQHPLLLPSLHRLPELWLHPAALSVLSPLPGALPPPLFAQLTPMHPLDLHMAESMDSGATCLVQLCHLLAV